jgi:AraC-like DNA-binding protein
MDALSDVLRVIRLKGGVFLHAQFARPWCLSVKILPDAYAPYLGDAARVMAYHYVIDGCMRVRLEDGPEFELGPGESVMFPHNDRHLLGSDLTLPPLPSERAVRRNGHGGLSAIVFEGSDAPTRIVCGFLGGAEVAGNPVVGALPPMLRLGSPADVSAEWVRSTFRYAAEEIARGRAGSEAVLAKLSELLFIEAVRRHVEVLPDGYIGWLAGLQDPFVSRAMALLHARLGEPWSVDGLAREVGLSRSALAERFARRLGMPPMQYLAQWRIHAAAQELCHTGKSILEIAAQVGYDSDASLTRAFKRVMGTPPGVWRQQQRSTGRAARSRAGADPPGPRHVERP